MRALAPFIAAALYVGSLAALLAMATAPAPRSEGLIVTLGQTSVVAVEAPKLVAEDHPVLQKDIS